MPPDANDAWVDAATTNADAATMAAMAAGPAAARATDANDDAATTNADAATMAAMAGGPAAARAPMLMRPPGLLIPMSPQQQLPQWPVGRHQQNGVYQAPLEHRIQQSQRCPTHQMTMETMGAISNEDAASAAPPEPDAEGGTRNTYKKNK